MKIRVEFEIVQSVITKEVELDEYGMTQEEWDKMSDEEKDIWLYDEVLDRMDIPSFVVCSKDEL